MRFKFTILSFIACVSLLLPQAYVFAKNQQEIFFPDSVSGVLEQQHVGSFYELKSGEYPLNLKEYKDARVFVYADIISDDEKIAPVTFEFLFFNKNGAEAFFKDLLLKNKDFIRLNENNFISRKGYIATLSEGAVFIAYRLRYGISLLSKDEDLLPRISWITVGKTKKNEFLEKTKNVRVKALRSNEFIIDEPFFGLPGEVYTRLFFNDETNKVCYVEISLKTTLSEIKALKNALAQKYNIWQPKFNSHSTYFSKLEPSLNAKADLGLLDVPRICVGESSGPRKENYAVTLIANSISGLFDEAELNARIDELEGKNKEQMQKYLRLF